MDKYLVEVALPVYNEEQELKENTLKLYGYLNSELRGSGFSITIADNASTDKTPLIGKQLAAQYKNIHFIRLEEKGRGRAIKKVWLESNAQILAYMDIDLSTSLDSFKKIITAISEKGYDVAIGSRLLPQSKIYKRPLQREILSRGLNIIIKIFFQIKFSDAQCGFKAISAKYKNILSEIKDNEWFFDSELLIIADKKKLKIYEEPVVWIDNPGSTVRVLRTVIGDLTGLVRLFFTRPWNKDKSLFGKSHS